MNVTLIAVRYAKALLDLAKEKQVLDRVYQDMAEITQVIRENRNLRLFFRAPVVNPGKKKSIVRIMFGNRFDPLTLSFLIFLIGKRREGLIPDIAKQFVEAYKTTNGILTVHLRAAVNVDDAIRRRVVEMMRRYTDSPRIELVEQTDPGLIGGFVISWKDYQYDASVRRQLERLRRGVARVNLYVKGF